MTEKGIAVRPVGQPTLERLIEVPVNVQGKVWDWLHDPGEIHDKEEWNQIRMPVRDFFLNVVDIAISYGPPIHREIFKKMIEVLQAKFK